MRFAMKWVSLEEGSLGNSALSIPDVGIPIMAIRTMLHGKVLLVCWSVLVIPSPQESCR